MAAFFYVPFFGGTRALRLVADLLLLKGVQWGLCVLGLAYFVEQVTPPARVPMLTAYRDVHCHSLTLTMADIFGVCRCLRAGAAAWCGFVPSHAPRREV